MVVVGGVSGGWGFRGTPLASLNGRESDEANERSEFTESSQLAQGQEQELCFTRVEGLPAGVFTGMSLGFTCWLAFAESDVINCNLFFSNIAVILNNSSDGCNPIL